MRFSTWITRRLAIFACSITFALPLAAADAPVFRIFDGKPKRLHLAASSHGGDRDLQALLKAAGAGYLTVSVAQGQPFVQKGYGPVTLGPGLLKAKPESPDEVTVALWQTDSFGWWETRQIALKKGKSEAEALAEANAMAMKQFEQRYELAKKELGVAEAFAVYYHHHSSGYRFFSQAIDPKDPALANWSIPHPNGALYTEEEPWVADVTKKYGRKLVFDGRVITQPYFPFVVGGDGRHNTSGRLPTIAIWNQWIKAVSAEEGTPLDPKPDIAAIFEQSKASRMEISDVKISGDLKVGGTATITWRAAPRLKTVGIKIWLDTSLSNHIYEAQWRDYPHGLIALSVPAQPGSFTWTIPAEMEQTGDKARGPKHALDKVPNFRIQVYEANEDGKEPWYGGNTFCFSDVVTWDK
jgi:hypothetical protein